MTHVVFDCHDTEGIHLPVGQILNDEMSGRRALNCPGHPFTPVVCLDVWLLGVTDDKAINLKAFGIGTEWALYLSGFEVPLDNH